MSGSTYKLVSTQHSHHTAATNVGVKRAGGGRGTLYWRLDGGNLIFFEPDFPWRRDSVIVSGGASTLARRLRASSAWVEIAAQKKQFRFLPHSTKRVHAPNISSNPLPVCLFTITLHYQDHNEHDKHWGGCPVLPF